MDVFPVPTRFSVSRLPRRASSKTDEVLGHPGAVRPCGGLSFLSVRPYGLLLGARRLRLWVEVPESKIFNSPPGVLTARRIRLRIDEGWGNEDCSLASGVV